jgi:protein-disulfide isomerase
LIEQYVEAGIVRMVYRDFPLPSHPSAPLAAVSGRCAGQQGSFWPMHDLLFATHGSEWGGVPNRDRDVMIEFAEQLDLDVAAFSECIDDPALYEAVAQEAAAAEQLGINSTPNFIIGGRLLRGALPLENFERAIELARSEAE